MLGISLALLSAATSGIAVVLVGRHAKESNAFNVSLLVSFVGLIVVWPFAVMLTEFKAVNLGAILLFALGGALTPGLVRLFYYAGLKNLGASVNSSIFSIYPLYSSLLAVLFLSEFPSLENWMGIITLVVGVIFLEMSLRRQNESGRSLRNWIFPVLGGLTFGLGAILRKAALNLYDAPFLGIAIAYSFSFLPYIVILGFHEPTRCQFSFRKNLHLFWAAGVGQIISWILSFYALSLQTVSVVTPLLSVEPLFVAIFGYFFLKGQEHLSPKLAVCIVVMVLGVVLVTI